MSPRPVRSASRPPLSLSITPDEFGRWYWLKSELRVFCRSLGLPTGGSKDDLSARIVAALSGRKVRRQPRSSPAAPAAMPTRFTPTTVIGKVWRCTADLRRYFESVHGKGFRFSAAIREIIRHGEGKTLADASAAYEASKGQPTKRIGKQFQFNQHMRDHHAQHPGSSHQQAIDAWKAKRSKPTR